MTATHRPRVNIHFYPSAFRFESRMLKTTGTAIDSGAVDEVLIVARWEEGLARTERIDEHRSVVRVATPLGDRCPGVLGKLVRLVEWQVRSIALMVRRRPTIVNPHSLPVLPLSLVVRLLTRASIVYDTHELETETIGASALRRRLGRLIERVCVPRCAAVTAVNHSIGRWYRERYPDVPVVVARNIPRRSAQRPTRVLRERCGVPDDHLLFLYQGTIDPGRSIPLLLDVFASCPLDRHVVFMGYGSLEDDVRVAAGRRPNIHFHPAVPPTDVLAHTASADVGLCVIENASLSYYLSLPNKLFEYISVGIPSIVSDFPEMSAAVRDLSAGWAVPVDTESVGRLVSSLERSEIDRMAAELRERAASLSWESEAEGLVEMYRAISSARERRD